MDYSAIETGVNIKQVIGNFYLAFKNLDADKMVMEYHDDVVFSDPAFGILHGEHAKNMWRMLCSSQKGRNFRIEFSDVAGFENKGSAHWEAYYVFSRTGRRIHNIIEAEFEFKDGKIIKHTDTFNLYSWSKQAFGLKGILIGWTDFFKTRLNEQTNRLLLQFENNKPG